MKLLKNLRWLAWTFCILIACVFAIKDFKQLDFYWMLRTGDYIIHNKIIPTTDILSYTFQGVEWLNIKWLFEVLIYFISYIGGPEFIPILQLLVNVLIVILIFKSSVLLNKLVGKKDKIMPTAGLIIATFLYLFGTEFRMTGRPEIISHLVTLVFLFLYLSYKNKPSRIIYLLIPLQIIWANSHDAFVNGCVISIVFLFSSAIEYFLFSKKPSTDYKFPKHLVIASSLSLLSVGINPKGYLLYAYPFKIFTSLNENNFTTEFLSCLNKHYWMGKESYLLVVAFILCCAGFLVYFKESDWKKRFLSAFKTVGLAYFLLIFLFFYLALSAERNVAFFMIISAPLVSVYLDNRISKFKLSVMQKQLGYIAICICSLIFYISVCNNSYYKASDIPYQYGLSINKNDNPAGTVQFIKENSISGTCFSDYLTSSVMLWHLRPDFKSYIDLRDLEVFTVPFFNDYQRMITDPVAFIQKDKVYKFDYAVIYPNDFATLHRYLYNSNDWVLAYLEPACALYLKKNKRNENIIKQLQLEKGADVFHTPVNYKPSAMAAFVSKVFWLPYKSSDNANINYTVFTENFYGMVSGNQHSESNNAINYKDIAQKYMDKEEWKEAIPYLEETIKTKEDVDTYLLLAQCAGAIHAQTSKDEFYMEQWFGYMDKAYVLDNNNPRVRLMLGLAYCMDKKDCKSANKYLDNLQAFNGITEDEIKLLKQCKEQCHSK